MARRLVTTQVDDLTGEEATQTFTLTFQGMAYIIDLTDENSRALVDALEPYLAVPRRVPGARARTRPRPSRPTPADVRAWAREQRPSVPVRGRIPQSVKDAYRAAH
ncbi:Lsr2 family protein [Cellulomonas sp. 73-145]|uniref:histone-like nucleoid-structuring protein Lsr2 n=1 Tax=Cellulomonas sp. 73-145 TaxID=1895739 RepID=UPI00344FFB0E